VRQQLAVDVQLSYAASYQLGELAPEVQDYDGIGLGRILPAALRGWCVERLLEVRLDLGIVRCEDAMAGIRRLAVDGAPPGRR